MGKPKVSNSNQLDEKAAELFEIIEKKKKLDKREKELKEEFKKAVGTLKDDESKSLILRGFTVSFLPRSTTFLDKGVAKMLLGDDYEKIEKTTPYHITQVQKI